MNTNADKQKRLPIFRERLNILKGHMTIVVTQERNR